MAKKKKNKGGAVKPAGRPAAAPIQNKALKNAMDALKQETTQENWTHFIKEAMKAKFLVPAVFNVDVKPDAQGRFRLPEGAAVSFVMVNTNQGRTFLPVFTDFEEAKKLNVTQPGHLQHIVRELKSYETILSDPRNTAEGIVINPMNENLVLPKPLVVALAKGMDPEKVTMNARPAPQQVQAVYSEPRIYPTALVNAVYEHCREIPAVSRVWLRQQTAGSEQAYALVVEADEKDAGLLNGIREAALPFAKETPVVVISYVPELEEKVIQGTVALYDREMEF